MKDKYIFFDIDGTLYDPVHKVPESTKEAIYLLRKNGHHPMVATGRTKCMLFDQILDLDFDGFICGAGSYIEMAGEVLYNVSMSPEETRRVVNMFVENGMYPFAEAHEHIYCDETLHEYTPYQIMNYTFNLNDPDIVRSVKDPEMVTVKVSGLKIKPDATPEKIREQLQDDYLCVYHTDIFFETISKKFSKGQAVKMLAEIKGFDMEDTYAYGDSFNDYDMLKTVKYGVAMGNSDPEMYKKIAYHAPQLEDNGIYQSLKEFGLI